MRKKRWLCLSMFLVVTLLGSGIIPNISQIIAKGSEVLTMAQQKQSDFTYTEAFENYDATDVRYRAQIDLNWKFIQDDNIDASAKDYDDSDWRLLNLPHDWSIEGEYSQENPSGGSGGYLPTGIGWYRKTLTIPEEWRDGRQVSIAFDGVFCNSTVYVDGEKVGGLEYGWLSFSCDITEQVQGKESVVIAVKVDNSVQPAARWYTGSGIYSHVWIVSTEDVHVAENGTYVTTLGDDKGVPTGEMNLETLVKNDGNADVDVTVRSTVYRKSDDGQVAQVTSPAVTVPANGDFTVTQTALVEHPEFWNTETPNLYYVKTEILVGDAVADDYLTEFGFRVITYDVNGMYLNGENIELKGVSNHWALGAVGAAQTTNVIRYKIQMMKDMGVNCIRTTHNACPPEFYQLCDEMGMMVMDEFSEGERGKTAGDYGTRWFAELWERDFEYWVRRDRNHPSVVVWSIGNETGSDTDNTGISAHIKQFDTTRPTTGSAIHYGVDIPGANGQSEPASFTQPVEDLPLIATEAPHTHAVRGVYRTQTWSRGSATQYPGGNYLPNLSDVEIFNYDWSGTATPARRLPSDYDNAVSQISVRSHWAKTRDNDWRIGEFRWTGFDYLGEANYVVGGWPYRMFHSGAVDSALFEKSMYYLYQSMWTEEPMIHILPSWTHPTMEEGTVVPVWVYSNCETVELYLNGELFETETRGPVEQRTDLEIQFDFDVPYTPGTITAVGYDADGNEVIRDTYTTAAAPSALALENTTGEEMPADPSYIGQVTVSTVDKDGNFYPYGENRTYYYVSGPAYIKAADNGSPVDTESHVNYNRNAFMGLAKVFVGATQDSGDILFTAASIVGEKQQLTSDLVSIDVQQLALRGNPETQTFDIYYTTDGSAPDKSSNKYTEAFAVELGTTVKAAVYVEGSDSAMFLMEERFAKDEGLYWAGSSTVESEANVYLAQDAEISEDLAYVKYGLSEYYVDFGGRSGWLEYTVNAEKAGDYYAAFCYNNGSGTAGTHYKTMEVLVNGNSAGTHQFIANGSWTTFWSYHIVKVTLNEGENKIRLDSGTGVGANFKELRLFAADDTYVASEANTLSGDDAIGSYPSGFDDEGVDVGANGGSVTWTVTDKPAGIYKLSFFYSTPNGSLREVTASVNGVIRGYFPGKKVSPNYGASWGYESIEVSLAPGQNVITISVPKGGTLLGAVILEEKSLYIPTPSVIDSSCVEDSRLFAAGADPLVIGGNAVSPNAAWDIVTTLEGDYYLVNRDTGMLLVSDGKVVDLANGEVAGNALWRRAGEALNYDYLIHVKSGKILALDEKGNLIVDSGKNYDDSNMRTNRGYWRISELPSVAFDFAEDTPAFKRTTDKPFTVTATAESVTYAVLSGPATVDALTGLVTLTGDSGTVLLNATATVGGQSVSAVHAILVQSVGIGTTAPQVYYAKDAVFSPTSGSFNCNESTNYYVDFANNYGSVDFTIRVPAAGEYYLAVGYASGSNSRYLNVEVNSTLIGTYLCHKNGGWTADPSYHFVKVTLNEGENSVRIIRPESYSIPCITDITVYPAEEWISALYMNVETDMVGSALTLKDYASGLDGKGFDNSNADGTVTWYMDVPVSGTYKIQLPYATSSVTSNDVAVIVGGQEIARLCANSATTGGYGVAWRIAETPEFHLDAGENIPVTFAWYGGRNLTGFRMELISADLDPIKVDVNATVKLTDKTLNAEDFEFSLLKDGAVLQTVKNDVDGTVLFTDLVFDQVGTYTYTLQQTKGDLAGVTYDETVYTVVVTVSDYSGILTASADVVPCFTNAYAIPFAEGEIVDGKYLVDGVPTEMGLIKIGDDYYYAGPNGVLVANQRYYAWRQNENCDLAEGWYAFDETGKMVKDGIFDGIYYENYLPTEKGLIQLGSDYYYAGPNGVLVVNQRYYAWRVENCDLPAANYRFDENGKMIGASVEGEIVTIDGVKYFYRSGKPTEMGLFEYEGNYYVAQYDGKIITGKYYVWKIDESASDIATGWYYFDAESGELLNGIADGYYYVNGKRTEMGLFEYEGNYYVAQYDGKIITSENYTTYGAGKYYVWKIHESAKGEIAAGWHFFDETGKLILEDTQNAAA